EGAHDGSGRSPYMAKAPGFASRARSPSDSRAAHNTILTSQARAAMLDGGLRGVLFRVPGGQADKEKRMFAIRKAATLGLAAGLILLGLSSSWPQAAAPATPATPATPAEGAPSQ